MALTVRKHNHKTLRQITFDKLRDAPIPKPLLVERDENLLLHLTEEDTLCPPHKVAEILEDLGGECDKQKDLINAIMADAVPNLVRCVPERNSPGSSIKLCLALTAINPPLIKDGD